MSGTTDQLIKWVNQVSNLHTPEEEAEHDVVVSSGEQVTSGLTALAIRSLGIPAVSLQAWQIPFMSDEMYRRARIENIDGALIMPHLKRGEVVVVPGFQGITKNKRVTTLGRGGSDTSAVALAAALNAERCDIYTDVEGVYTSDPRLVS